MKLKKDFIIRCIDEGLVFTREYLYQSVKLTVEEQRLYCITRIATSKIKCVSTQVIKSGIEYKKEDVEICGIYNSKIERV